MTHQEATPDRFPEAAAAELERELAERSVGEVADEAAAHLDRHAAKLIARTPLQQQVRAELDLPANALLLVTTNHIGADTSPWTVLRIVFGELVAERLNAAGHEAVNLMVPLEHNTVGDDNRPTRAYLDGHSVTLRPFPQTRGDEVVGRFELGTAGEEAAAELGAQVWEGVRRLAGQWPDELDRASVERWVGEGLARVRRVLGCAEGNAADGFTAAYAETLRELGFARARVIPMAAFERACRPFYAQLQARADEVRRAIAETHSGILADGYPESGLETWLERGLWRWYCDCDERARRVMQDTAWDGTARCRYCGRDVRIAPSDDRDWEPTVLPLYLGFIYALPQALHTSGPQMSFYERAVSRIGARLEGERPPYLYQHCGRSYPLLAPGPGLLSAVATMPDDLLSAGAEAAALGGLVRQRGAAALDILGRRLASAGLGGDVKAKGAKFVRALCERHGCTEAYEQAAGMPGDDAAARQETEIAALKAQYRPRLAQAGIEQRAPLGRELGARITAIRERYDLRSKQREDLTGPAAEILKAVWDSFWHGTNLAYLLAGVGYADLRRAIEPRRFGQLWTRPVIYAPPWVHDNPKLRARLETLGELQQ